MMFSFFKLFSTDVPASLRSSTLNRQDFMFALLAMASVLGLYCFFPWDHLHPQVWEGVVAALELAPDAPVQGGLWRYFVRALLKYCDFLTLQQGLHLMGALSGAFCAGVAFLTCRMFIPLLLRTHGTEMVAIRFFVDCVLLALVWLLALSEPYWNFFRFFTDQTFLFTLAMSAILMLIAFLVTFRVSCLLACNLLTGMLVGCSFLGIVLVVVECVAIVVSKYRWASSLNTHAGFQGMSARNGNGSAVSVPQGMPLLNPLIAERIKTPLAVALFAGFLIGTSTDVLFALRTPGQEVGDVLMRSLQAYLADLKSFATSFDLIVTFLLVVFPLFVNVWYCQRATDTDKFLPRWLSVLYLITAVAAYTQISAFGGLWYWTWGFSSLRPLSPLYLALLSLGALGVVVTSMLVFLVDGCCRDFTRLLERYSADTEHYVREAERCLGRSVVRGGRRITRAKGAMFVMVILAFCALSFFSRHQSHQQTVMRAIADYGAEIACECATCDNLVTDGGLDDLLHVCLYARGCRTELVCASDANASMNKVGENTAWLSDLPSLYLNGGWDFSGLVARRAVDAREAVRSRKAVFDLACRFVQFDRYGTLHKTRDRFLKNVSNLIKWRLARTLNIQLQELGRKDVAQAERLEGLLRALDAENAPFKAALAKFDGRGLQSVVELTPQEGLELAVQRGDYELARRYVDAVLKMDGESALGLFARGMICLVDERYAAAAEALRRAAAQMPNEHAVLNNLAVALARAGKRVEAKEWIRKARELPGADAVVKANAEELLK